MKPLIYLLIILAAFAGGAMVQWQWTPLEAGNQSMDMAGENSDEPLYWVAPMDPNYRRDKPGKSPMGMDLVPVYAEDNSAQGDVTIAPAVINNLGVRTGKVTRSDLSVPVETVGYVAFDESRLIHIHGRVDGWIEKLWVSSEGDPVKRGQTLYELYSPTLVNAQEEYLAALRSKNAGLIQASTARLSSLGVSDQQIQRLRQTGQAEQRIKVTAALDGVVNTLNVRQGMYVKPAMEVLSIGSLDTVWVIAEVFERQSGLIRPGQPVAMEVSALPGKTWQGKVDYLYPVLDSKTRTLQVRIRFENQDRLLRPNMFATLTIHAPVAEAALSIPRAALIRGGRQDRVVLRLDDGSFQSVPVKAGVEAGEHIQIMSGLQEGDEVVTSAQFLIDSESSIEAEVARMESRKKAAEERRVTASAQVEKLMPGMNMVTLTHEPIAEWSWPEMKMDFELAEGVSLEGIQPGDQVRVEIVQAGEWEYLLSRIEPAQNNMASMAEPAAGRSVTATGKVVRVMPDMEMVEVVHDPIPEWQWPTMKMMFSVAPAEMLKQLKADQTIRFTLTETPDGEYLLSRPEQR